MIGFIDSILSFQSIKILNLFNLTPEEWRGCWTHRISSKQKHSNVDILFELCCIMNNHKCFHFRVYSSGRRWRMVCFIENNYQNSQMSLYLVFISRESAQLQSDPFLQRIASIKDFIEKSVDNNWSNDEKDDFLSE